MNKELEALNDIRKVLEEAYKFPLNLTPQYKFIYEALKRNEPMKVIVGFFDYCPKCGETLRRFHIYCYNCGQKLDWSDDK